MKKTILLTVLAISTYFANAQELPPNAVPGKCYIKCTLTQELKEETETIQISPEFKRLKTIPATFKTVDVEVLVKEPSVRKIFHPAEYETILVEVSCEEAQAMANAGGNGNNTAKLVNYRAIPAEFGQDAKTIEVYPKVGKWEYTQLKECPSANKDDCIVACYVERPSRSITVPIATLVKDASIVEIPIQCNGFSYKKQVIKTPERVEEIAIPAQYSTVKRKVIDVPAQVVEEVVPAETKTITKTILGGNGNEGKTTTWEEVDCNIASGANILPINYELNSALITPESKSIIDQNLLNLMTSKPGLKIEIMSHTDARGEDNYNMVLSQQRAQSVVNYLVSNGISRNRLVARGYGETKLKNNCRNGVECAEEEHHVNRRTEFRIIR